jgi:DeoR family transcriptional regulator, suf operon transcriptional repressor
VSHRLAAQYADDVASGVLSERVAELIQALADRGVLADMTIAQEDIIVLKTYNCPYHELAQEHRDICNMDEQLLREVLGSDVTLRECMMDGHHRCSFVIGGVDVIERKLDEVEELR